MLQGCRRNPATPVGERFVCFLRCRECFSTLQLASRFSQCCSSTTGATLGVVPRKYRHPAAPTRTTFLSSDINSRIAQVISASIDRLLERNRNPSTPCCPSIGCRNLQQKHDEKPSHGFALGSALGSALGFTDPVSTADAQGLQRPPYTSLCNRADSRTTPWERKRYLKRFSCHMSRRHTGLADCVLVEF